MKPNCWWCCHPFEWESLHFPYAFVSNTFHTTGHFCSWECMKAYGINRGKFETCDFITLMKKRVEGKISYTTSAPKKECLEMFGGTVSIDEYRKGRSKIQIKIPGDYFNNHIIVKSDQITSTPVQQDGLKLKRDKPLERSKSKLETTLGITRKCPAAVTKESQPKK